VVFQVTGAFAEFERSMIRQRIKAGLRRAVASGKRDPGLAEGRRGMIRAADSEGTWPFRKRRRKRCRIVR
jgi:DNA invertase Pin-like site-specific DNA recombinase